MNGEFAKLFGSGDRQVVVIRQANDEGNPEVRIFFNPPSPHINVSSIGISFSDTEKGEKSADVVFESMDEERARKAVNKTLSGIGLAVEGRGE